MIAAIVVAVLAFAVALMPWLMRLRLEYDPAVPAAWFESCFGGGSTASELLEWEGAGEARPELADQGSSLRYECEWTWRAEGGGGQRLSVTIDVDGDRAYGEFDPSIEEGLGLGSEDWYADAEKLDGWEHGLCRQVDTDLDTSRYECIASESNLRLTIESRDIPGGNGFDDKHFGPGGVSVEDLTVELGALVRSAFRD